MLAHRRPRDVELSSDVACGQLVVPDEPQDLQPARSSDNLERVDGELPEVDGGIYLRYHLNRFRHSPTRTWETS